MKDTNRMKRQDKDWEKIFAKLIPDQKPVPKICKEFSKLNKKKTNLNLKGIKHFNRHFTKENTQLENEHTKNAEHHSHG